MASLRTLVWFSALAFALFRVGEGKDFLVGGSEDAWKIPKNASDSLNHWARKHRFRVGDFLGNISHIQPHSSHYMVFFILLFVAGFPFTKHSIHIIILLSLIFYFVWGTSLLRSFQVQWQGRLSASSDRGEL